MPNLTPGRLPLVNWMHNPNRDSLKLARVSSANLSCRAVIWPEPFTGLACLFCRRLLEHMELSMRLTELVEAIDFLRKARWKVEPPARRGRPPKNGRRKRGRPRKV